MEVARQPSNARRRKHRQIREPETETPEVHIRMNPQPPYFQLSSEPGPEPKEDTSGAAAASAEPGKSPDPQTASRQTADTGKIINMNPPEASTSKGELKFHATRVTYRLPSFPTPEFKPRPPAKINSPPYDSDHYIEKMRYRAYASSSRNPVTFEMWQRLEKISPQAWKRAEKIVDCLPNCDHWHTHSECFPRGLAYYRRR